MNKNQKKIANLLISNPDCLRPNIAELIRESGLTRNTISKIFREIWSNGNLRFIISEETTSLERKFVAVKLQPSNLQNIKNFKQNVRRFRGIFEILVVEGTELDLLVKVVASGPSDFAKTLFQMKELENVVSAEVAYTILQENDEGYSEYEIEKSSG